MRRGRRRALRTKPDRSSWTTRPGRSWTRSASAGPSWQERPNPRRRRQRGAIRPGRNIRGRQPHADARPEALPEHHLPVRLPPAVEGRAVLAPLSTFPDQCGSPSCDRLHVCCWVLEREAGAPPMAETTRDMSPGKIPAANGDTGPGSRVNLDLTSAPGGVTASGPTTRRAVGFCHADRGVRPRGSQAR